MLIEQNKIKKKTMMTFLYMYVMYFDHDDVFVHVCMYFDHDDVSVHVCNTL